MLLICNVICLKFFSMPESAVIYKLGSEKLSLYVDGVFIHFFVYIIGISMGVDSGGPFERFAGRPMRP